MVWGGKGKEEEKKILHVEEKGRGKQLEEEKKQ
jgi:hypothetical protein